MPGAPFKPGYDARRNLTGRPTEAKELMDVLRSQIPYEKIALALDKLVDAGDPGTIKYMVDRHLGTPAQSIQISGDEERPLHALIGVEPRHLGAPQAPPDAPQRLPAPTEGDGAVHYDDGPGGPPGGIDGVLDGA